MGALDDYNALVLHTCSHLSGLTWPAKFNVWVPGSTQPNFQIFLTLPLPYSFALLLWPTALPYSCWFLLFPGTVYYLEEDPSTVPGILSHPAHGRCWHHAHIVGSGCWYMWFRSPYPPLNCSLTDWLGAKHSTKLISAVAWHKDSKKCPQYSYKII